MDSLKRRIILLVIISVCLVYVLHLVTEKWNNVHVSYSGKTILHDKVSQQRQSNRTLSASQEMEDSINNNKTVNVEWNYRHQDSRNIQTESNDMNGTEHSSLRNHMSANDSYQLVKAVALAERRKVLQNIAQKHYDKCINNCDNRLAINKKSRYKFFQSSFKVNDSVFSAFKENGTISECNGKIEIHYKHFAILHDVTLCQHKWQANGLTEAGKKLHTFKSHKLRTDDGEVLRPVEGLLTIHCQEKHVIRLDNKTLDNVMMLKYLTVNRFEKSNHHSGDEKELAIGSDYERRFTIAIQREEYANFYHIMLHMHSIFTMLMVFHQQPINISILIFDAHPQAEVDEMLETLYGPLIRVTKLKRNVKFQNLVLSPKESKSVLSKYWINSLPHLEEFRTFVYNQYVLNENHFRNCRKLTITFIWRRDKIWHPRNLKGTVQRKIFNEAEIYKVVYDKYPNVCINGVLLESVPMKEQLTFIGKTDILIGMHGAGLTHALFLPKTSGLIELFPKNFRKLFHYYKLFEVIARRRDLHYLYWENTIDENEMPNYFTRVDPVPFLSLVDSMIQKVCAKYSQNYR